MVQHPEIVEQTIAEHNRRHPLTVEQKFRILDGMQELAESLNRFTRARINEGLAEKIRRVQALQSYAEKNSR